MQRRIEIGASPRSIGDHPVQLVPVQGPCLLNVVWRGKTPEVAFGEAERMGYRLAIVPGMLFKAVIRVCDATLSELRRTDGHPVPMQSMTVREAFRRVGADEWDAISERFGFRLASRRCAAAWWKCAPTSPRRQARHPMR
jgi:hypothetical protein